LTPLRRYGLPIIAACAIFVACAATAPLRAANLLHLAAGANENTAPVAPPPAAAPLLWNYDPIAGRLAVTIDGQERTCRLADPANVSALRAFRDAAGPRVNYARRETSGTRTFDVPLDELCPPAERGAAERSVPDPSASRGTLTCATGFQSDGIVCAPIICPIGQRLAGSSCLAIVCAPDETLNGDDCIPDKPPTRYVALALGATNHLFIGTAWNRSSPEDAEREALLQCRNRAGASAAAKCRIIHSVGDACAALAWTPTGTGWGSAVRPTRSEAESAAMDTCRGYNRRGKCVPSGSWCNN
jgi:hypothetical protein